MIRRALLLLALGLLLTSLSGCWLMDIGGSEPTSVVALNERGDEIWVEDFWYAGFNWPAGVLTKWEKESSPVYPPYPDVAKFRWKDGQGAWHEQEVKIDPPLPNSFKGKIYFRFQPDGSIKVTPVTWKDYHSGKDGPEVWDRQR